MVPLIIINPIPQDTIDAYMKSGQRVPAAHQSDFEADDDDDEVAEENELADFKKWLDENADGGEAPSKPSPISKAAAKAAARSQICQLCKKDATNCH